MNEEIKVDVELTQADQGDEQEQEPNSGGYSVDMMDTMFADSLSRGMHNAIISQQNAQMASSASITTACARILEAATEKAVADEIPKKKLNNEQVQQIDIEIEEQIDLPEPSINPGFWLSLFNLWPWLLAALITVIFTVLVLYFQTELKAQNQQLEQQHQPIAEPSNDSN